MGTSKTDADEVDEPPSSDSAAKDDYYQFVLRTVNEDSNALQVSSGSPGSDIVS